MYNVTNIFDMISKYFSNPFCLLLFVISLLYMLVVFDNQKRIALVVALISLFIFINDYVRLFFEKKMGEEAVFYRHLWMIPVATIISLSYVDLCKKIKYRIIKCLMALMGFAFLLCSSINSSPMLYLKNRGENVYLLSEEELIIGEKVNELEDKVGKHLFIACPSGIISALDLYNESADYSSFEYIGRIPEQEELKNEVIVKEIISSYCEKGIDYIISNRIEDCNDAFTRLGYQTVLMTDHYVMYECTGFNCVRKDVNKWGKLAWQMYCDSEEKPRLNDAGYSKVVYDYDKIGNIIKESYFDEKQDLKCRTDILYAYKEMKYAGHNLVSERYYNEKGNLILSNKGYAGFDRIINDGKLTREVYIGTDGKVILIPSGYAGIEYSYDREGNMASRSFLDTSGFLFDRGDKWSREQWEYDDEGRRIKESYQDCFGKPFKTVDGYYGFITIYDDESNSITNILQDENGNEICSVKGFSRVKYISDDSGNLLMEIYMDDTGTIVTTTDGLVGYKYIYENGKRVGALPIEDPTSIE